MTSSDSVPQRCRRRELPTKGEEGLETGRVFWGLNHMKKICLLTCVIFFSWLGWRLVAPAPVMRGYLASFAGSVVGVLVGCRINRDYPG